MGRHHGEKKPLRTKGLEKKLKFLHDMALQDGIWLAIGCTAFTTHCSPIAQLVERATVNR
jgi:hypothetical protein